MYYKVLSFLYTPSLLVLMTPYAFHSYTFIHLVAYFVSILSAVHFVVQVFFFHISLTDNDLPDFTYLTLICLLQLFV